MLVSHWMLSEMLSWKQPFACWWALQILLQSCLSCLDNIKHSKTPPYARPSTSPFALQVVLSFSAMQSACFLSKECVFLCVCVRVSVHSLRGRDAHCLHSGSSFLAKKNCHICCFVHRVPSLIANSTSGLLIFSSLDTKILPSVQMRDYFSPFLPCWLASVIAFLFLDSKN